MASIFERKVNNSTAYYLNERVEGKPKLTYLGTKRPIPKSLPRTNLSPEWVERLKRKAKQRATKPAPNPTLPDGKFQVIYADPPWQYDFSRVEAWGIEAHYNTLSVDQIMFYKDAQGTPIQDKFADDAVLFIWATQPKLKEALQVIEAWGFNYTTGAIWVKDRLGMGYWWMQKHELLLLAKRGNVPAPDTGRRPPSIIEAPWSGHSKKPKRIYRMIETMCPVPDSYQAAGRDYYLELFKRGTKRPFWSGWGQEYG